MTAPLPEAELRWEPGPAGGWRLRLGGDWRGRGTQALAGASPPSGRVGEAEAVAAPASGGGGAITVDATALTGWDLAFAVALWTALQRWRAAGAEPRLEGLPPGLAHLLQLSSSPADAEAPPPMPALKGTSLLAFVGEVILATGAALRGRGAPRAAAVLQQLDECGPRSVGIVLLACALLGLMLAYMGGAQLGRIGAQNHLADVVAVGMVRELGGMMTGIILAGRVGSAFAAQLATMKAGEEIDALRVLGVDPVAHLVLPRVLALLLAGPALIVLGALAGLAAGWPAATLAYGVPSVEYLAQAARAVTGTHLWIGLFKGQLYVLLVALAGCRAGLDAGRSAEAVGAATTRAVVTGLIWIVAAASGTTVVFTALGY